MPSGISRRRWLGATLLAAGCRRTHRKVIAVIPMGRAHVFWQSIHAGSMKAAREHGVDIEWNGPAAETDKTAQLQIMETMINKRVDAIALAPIDHAAMVSVVERAVRQHIPVVIFDSPVDTEVFAARVTTDNYRGGEMAAARVAEILGGSGAVAIVAAQIGSASSTAREQGFERYMAEHHDGIRILDKRYGDAEVAKSLRVAENLLTAHPDLDALFASNETSAVGAAQALKGRRSRVKLVGFDAGPTLEADLRSGVIDSLVVQNPFKMGYDAVNSAVRTIRGEPVEKIQTIPPRLVTKANIDDPDVQQQINPDLDQFLT